MRVRALTSATVSPARCRASVSVPPMLTGARIARAARHVQGCRPASRPQSSDVPKAKGSGLSQQPRRTGKTGEEDRRRHSREWHAGACATDPGWAARRREASRACHANRRAAEKAAKSVAAPADAERAVFTSWRDRDAPDEA